MERRTVCGVFFAIIGACLVALGLTPLTTSTPALADHTVIYVDADASDGDDGRS